MASSVISEDSYFKSATITATTDSNGNLPLSGVSEPMKMVLLVSDNNKIFIPFRYNNVWYARAQSTNSSGTAITNTSITATVYYQT